MLLAFASSFVFTYLNIYTSSKFGSYFFLFYRHWSVLLYAFVYGVCGIFWFILLSKTAIKENMSETTTVSTMILAIGAGISTRGLADIVLFNVKYGRQVVPIGIRTFSKFVDTVFEDVFDATGYTRMTGFVKPYLQCYAGVQAETFKRLVIQELSAHPAKEKVAVFAKCLATVDTTREILDILLRDFGQCTYKAVCNSLKPAL